MSLSASSSIRAALLPKLMSREVTAIPKLRTLTPNASPIGRGRPKVGLRGASRSEQESHGEVVLLERYWGLHRALV
jgi:hypothetical protein